MKHRLIAALAAAGLITSVPLLAAVDGLEAARSSVGANLRWENVTGAPYWVAGAKPSASKQRNWRAVELSEEKGVAIRIPERAMLRVIAEQEGSPQAPLVSISNGSGLAFDHKPIPADDGHSWLIRNDAAHPVVIHLKRPSNTRGPQRFALFVGDVESPAQPVSYRRELSLEGEKARVRQASEGLARSFIRVPSEKELTVTVTGPERLQLEYLLESERSSAAMTLNTTLDGKPARLIHQVTGPASSEPVQIDGDWRPAGRKESAALDIPAGTHTLRLQSSHPILLRAALGGNPDFLLPDLNFPQEWAELGSDTGLEAREEKTVAAAVSNQWGDIGALASDQLQREAARRPEEGALQSTADELRGMLTRYRDLSPLEPSTTTAASVAIELPQSPKGQPQNRIAGPEAAFGEVPVALFHEVGETLRFALPEVPYPRHVRALVPRDVGPLEIEVRYDNGETAMLRAGVEALQDEDLRPNAAAMAMAAKDAWPAGLGGHADRAGSLAAAKSVASVEWTLPAYVRQLSLHTRKGTVPVALQWAEGNEYSLDDAFLAQLAQGGAGSESAKLIEAAQRPLTRRIAAAREQYIANVSPLKDVPATQPAQAARAAEAAQQEADPVRAVELWQQAMRTNDAALKERALHGMTRALLLAGERFTAERLLRAHWMSEDAVLSKAAEEELDALYAREGDREMQVLFAAARAAQDKSAYGELSTALAAQGDDETALLAGLLAESKDMPALLQSALRSGKWKTFDALVQQLPASKDRAFWQAQRELSLGRIDAAERHFQESGAEEWNTALQQGRTIAERMNGSEEDKRAAVQAWLQWQTAHPGAKLWQDQPDALVRHGGGVRLRSIALGSRSTWWRASEAQPLTARVVGPARIRVEARPLHETQDALSDGWLKVRTTDQLWLQPFQQNQTTSGLQLEGAKSVPGTSVVREINLPAGVHELHIDAGAVPVIARLQVERPALQLPVLPAPVASHFQAQTMPNMRAESAPLCGLSEACHLVADGSLSAYRVSHEPMQWNGLPVPPTAQDPVAAHLAQGDIDAALKAANDTSTNPQERMSILLWLAEKQPEQRSLALAQGAALAKDYPEQAIRAQWNQLSQAGTWSLIPLVDRSAGLRPVEVPQGTAQSPTARIREATMPALREGEVRIGGDTRAGLVLNNRLSSSLEIEVSADDLPGNASLPMEVIVERNGRSLRTVRLNAKQGTVKIPVSVPAGQQHVAVSLKQPYANQFLRVRFKGPARMEPTIARDWHIATKEQPVRLTLSGPTWIRIDRLEKDGVRSEERLVTDKVARLELPPQPGAKESLYRIHQLRVNPAEHKPLPPQPNNYAPAPLPEAPAEWHAAAETAPQHVRFVDGESLEGQRNSTWTARASAQRRRDIEASGALQEPLTERFIEGGLAWRQRDEESGLAKFAEVLVRNREDGSPVLGFKLRAEQEVNWLAVMPRPFTVSASLDGYAQEVDDTTGKSLLFRTSISQTQQITSTWSHKPEIEFQARSMNVDSVSDPREVDTDIFSLYRSEHKRALTIGDTVSWRPRRDTHLYASLSATTNPDLDLTDVDHHRATIGWRQLAGPMIFDVGASATRYWADTDRPEAQTRRELRLGASGDVWIDSGNRVEVGAEVRYDIDESSTWGGVQMRWHWGPGRQLRDFSSSEIDFAGLRSWRAPVSHNRIEEE